MRHSGSLKNFSLLLVATLPLGAACVDAAKKDDGVDPLVRPDATASDTTTGSETETTSACTALEQTYLDFDGDGACGATKQCPVSGVKACQTQVTANDCNDNDAAIFLRNYEPTISGTAAKTDKKDNDCDNHTDEDDLKLVIAFDPSVANGTFLNTTSSVVTSVAVKAKVTVSGWVDDVGSLTATLKNETAGTTTSKTFTMKNGATTIDFGAQPITATRIAQPFLLTIAGWDDETVGARTVLYNLAGRKVAKAQLLDSVGKTVTAGTTITNAMGMAINEAMTDRMFSNMSGDLSEKFDIDYTAYPADRVGTGITSDWGQPVHQFEESDSHEWNDLYAYNSWIDGYMMNRKISAERISIEAIPYNGKADGLPNSEASDMWPDETSAVSANSLTIRFVLEGVEFEFSEQDFRCLIQAGCQAKDGIIQTLHDDLVDNKLTSYSADGASTDYYSVRMDSLRVDITGMMTVPVVGTKLGVDWTHGAYGAVTRSYPKSAEASLPSIDANNDPYQELVSREGQLAFVVAKMGIMVKNGQGQWIAPASASDIHFTTSNDVLLPDEKIRAAIYGLARDLPTNVALEDEIFDDWFDAGEDDYGYQFLLSMFNAILGRANPLVEFTTQKADDILLSTADHHLEIGDRVTVKSLPTSSGISVGSNYYVKDVVDARRVKLSVTAGGSVVDLKADGAGSLVEGPYGAHPARFATEYDLLEHAMDCMYAKQWSNESAALKLQLKESGQKTYQDQFYTGVDVLSDKSLAFTYGTRVYLPSTPTGSLCNKPITAYQNSGQYISAGAATNLSGTAEEISRVRFVESMFNGGFFAAAPGGTCTTQVTPFDCNGDGTIATTEAVTMRLEGRAPFVEMPSDAQGYDMVLEGLALTLSPTDACVLAGPAACLSGQSKASDPVDTAKTPVFLGGSRLSMRFAQPSNEHVREAEDNYGWAHSGNNICHSPAGETPLTMLNEIALATSGGMVGSTWAKAGCSSDALAGKMLDTLNDKMTSATLNALKAKACGDPNAYGVYVDAFETLIPVGVDMTVYANVSAYCADTSEDAEVAMIYVQRKVSPGVAVDQVLIGGPASTQVANTAAITLTEWPGDGEDLCGDPGIDLCWEYGLCGQCCAEGTECTMANPFQPVFACQ